MYKKLRILTVILLIPAVLQLSACSNGQQEQGEKQGLRMAIVTSPSGVDDGSFNQDIYNGIISFTKKYPEHTVKAIREENGDAAAAVRTVEEIVADYDVIICCGFQFSGIAAVAQDNPAVKFILVDAEPADAEGKIITAENIYAMKFAEEESGFFAGVAAAMETSSNKVAVINGIAYPSNVNYQYGFECGVRYVNETEGKKVEAVALPSYAGTDLAGNQVGGNYIGSFADEAGGKVVGNALIQEGCDILFVAAGDSGNGVFTAAKEAEGVYVIGCDVDQYDDGFNGKNSIVLTSALKRMGVNVEHILEQIQTDQFRGENVLLRADTDSTGYVSIEERNHLSEASLKKLETAYQQVKDGALVPASSINGMTPETFVIPGK